MSNLNTFNQETPESLQRLLKSLNDTGARVRLFYGDTKTGRAWAEENYITGRIGCSGGTKKIPLILKAHNSTGGCGILDGCIVALMVGAKFEYKHPNFSTGNFTVCHGPCADALPELPAVVYHDGKLQARFKTHKQAQRYCDFMEGKRMTR